MLHSPGFILTGLGPCQMLPSVVSAGVSAWLNEQSRHVADAKAHHPLFVHVCQVSLMKELGSKTALDANDHWADGPRRFLLDMTSFQMN